MQAAFLSVPGNGFALLRMKGLIFGAVEPGVGWAVGSRALPGPQPHRQPSQWGRYCSPLHLFFMSDFLQCSKHEMCCIVASVFVVFPAQLEAGGTRNSEMGKKKTTKKKKPIW